ncbi:prolipoprotein diacylglyceryl transferase [Sporosalibacterium faouarense]|uniref:prolipoprotein diacylglyceryl transferase n=1 Tax=Sporosalibacterium faouarense TaxID=516123 RepID=UPI00141CBD7B|nr:prolipoprotein diacylglyceryl transferase [Sporosalibacterium faouarense]MTI48535.1 prolipoprotein diacylglyceryl transferase [Bacillota bacterium]
MKVLFNIGGFSIYMFGFFIALGMLAGYLVAMKEAKRRNYNVDTLVNFILYAIISGVLGARLYYVLVFNLDYYINNPIKILAFRDGGLSIQGALIAGIITTVVYAKVKKINIWKIADIVAPGIILGQGIGRIGCDVFGIEMIKEYFWGINLNGVLLHPAQIYEAVLNFILFGILWSRRKSIRYDGQLFFTYLIGFSINRFIVEFFRVNPIVIGPLTVAHVTSIVIIIISLIIMTKLKRKSLSQDKEINKNYSLNAREIIAIISLIIVSILSYYWIWI